jgi:hypothetical protein
MSKALDIAENLSLLSTKYTSSSTTLDSVVLGSSTTDHASRALTGTFNGTIGSTATFPAGRIIKVVSTNGSNEYLTTATAWGSSTKIADLETIHTCASSSNKVLLSATFIAKPKGTFYYADFYKIVSGTTTYNLSGETEGIVRVYEGGGNHHATIHMQLLFTPSSDVAHTYGASFRSYSDVSANAGGNDSASNLTVYEIQG